MRFVAVPAVIAGVVIGCSVRQGTVVNWQDTWLDSLAAALATAVVMLPVTVLAARLTFEAHVRRRPWAALKRRAGTGEPAPAAVVALFVGWLGSWLVAQVGPTLLLAGLAVVVGTLVAALRWSAARDPALARRIAAPDGWGRADFGGWEEAGHGIFHGRGSGGDSGSGDGGD